MWFTFYCFPAIPLSSLQAITITLLQIRNLRQEKKRENEDKETLQRLQQQQNTISDSEDALFIKDQTRYSLALHQSWIESISTKSIFHILENILFRLN